MRQHEATLENEHLLGDPRPKTIALAGWEVAFFYPRSKDRPVLWRLFWRMLCNGGGAAEGNPFIDWHSDWNCRWRPTANGPDRNSTRRPDGVRHGTPPGGDRIDIGARNREEMNWRRKLVKSLLFERDWINLKRIRPNTDATIQSCWSCFRREWFFFVVNRLFFNENFQFVNDLVG